MVRRYSDVYSDWLDTTYTPEIKVCGRVLEKFGFSVGTSIMVTIEQGRIVIAPVSEDLED